MKRAAWTTLDRAQALRHFGDEIALDYGIWMDRPNLSVVESGVHELAHAVSLRLRLGTPPTKYVAGLTTRVAIHCDELTGDAEVQEEDRALAIEWLVLRRLGLRIGRRAVEAAARRDYIDVQVRLFNVQRLMRLEQTQRQAQRVCYILDALCAAWARAGGTS